ncbi:uncharacterized protein LOC134200367 [Bombyx mori]|uniref:uncharacterized protein LOC134200367 n=1 Tax=Bombyx mori TaxID=7091 RepID=UPI002ED5AA2F
MRLKQEVERKRQDCQNQLSRYFDQKPQNFYSNGIMCLPTRWQKVIEQNVDNWRLFASVYTTPHIREKWRLLVRRIASAHSNDNEAKEGERSRWRTLVQERLMQGVTTLSNEEDHARKRRKAMVPNDDHERCTKCFLCRKIFVLINF